jgi:hypothetical protein
MSQCIVVPLDGSAAALQAFLYTTSLAKATGVKIEMVEAITT